MAIVFDNANSTHLTVSATTQTLLHTAAAGSVLLFAGFNRTDLNSLSAVRAGGVALTLLNYAGEGKQLWVLTAPATGTLTISAVAIGANPWAGGIAAVTYTGQKTDGDPFGGIVSASAANATNLNLAISSTVGNAAIALWFTRNSAGAAENITLDGSQTQRVNVSVGPSLAPYSRIAIGEVPGASLVSASASASGGFSPFTGIGLNLIASASAPAGGTIWNYSLGLMNCGR